MTLDLILIKVASRCNLACDYCYVYQKESDAWRFQPNRMELKTWLALIDRIAVLKQANLPDLVLHGGEPLLLGAKRLKTFFSSLRSRLNNKCRVSIQTNGVLLTDQILDLCAEFDVTLGISLDGPKYIHDQHRFDHQGKGSYSATLVAISKLENHPKRNRLFSALLSVANLSIQPEEWYNHLKSFKPAFIDVILPDGNFEFLPHGKSDFEDISYGSWYTKLIDVYLSDPNPISIRSIDRTIKAIIRNQQNRPQSWEGEGVLVVETDGTICKNDLLKTVSKKEELFVPDWSVSTTSLGTILSSPHYHDYLNQQRPASSTCLSCNLLETCQGGNVHTRWSEKSAYINPSIYCNDYKLILGHITQRLKEYHHGANFEANTRILEDIPAEANGRK